MYIYNINIRQVGRCTSYTAESMFSIVKIHNKMAKGNRVPDDRPPLDTATRADCIAVLRMGAG